MKILLQYWKLSFLSLFEYKVSFLIQIFSMIINNTLVLSIWYMFFMKFVTIWWIDFWYYVLLLSIMTMVFAIVHIFFGWYYNIWTMIEQWKLDSHLLLPKNILIRLLSNDMMVVAFGDLLFAFMLMYFIPNLSFILVLKIILLSILWAITFLWFLLIFTSLSFFIWSSRNLVRWVFEAILSPGHYPPTIFEWTVLKYIFMTLIPVYFVVFLPYELAMNFDLIWFVKLLFGSLFFLFLWVFTFYTGLKKYESGNMLNTNV